MSNFYSVFNLLIKRYYGSYKKSDFIKIIIGISIIIVCEIQIISQINFEETYISIGNISAVLLITNVYLGFLFVNTQWREPYMQHVCMLPIKARKFWLAQMMILFLEVCLRRTCFFFILPLILFFNHAISHTQLFYWIFNLVIYSIYAILIAITLGNLFIKKESFRLFIHSSILILTLYLLFSQLLVGVLIITFIHVIWVITLELPKFLNITLSNKKNTQSIKLGIYSLYKREWYRFFSLKAMCLNYIILIIFIIFFSHNLYKTDVIEFSSIINISTILLLSSSPLALLFSIEKNHRTLLLIMPIRLNHLIFEKYKFYVTLLLFGFILISLFLSLLFNESLEILNIIQCIILLLSGAAIRLISDFKKPLLNWENEQKLWSNYYKYKSYFYCIPLFLTLFLNTLTSIILILLIFPIIILILKRARGDFFDQYSLL